MIQQENKYNKVFFRLKRKHCEQPLDLLYIEDPEFLRKASKKIKTDSVQNLVEQFNKNNIQNKQNSSEFVLKRINKKIFKDTTLDKLRYNYQNDMQSESRQQQFEESRQINTKEIHNIDILNKNFTNIQLENNEDRSLKYQNVINTINYYKKLEQQDQELQSKIDGICKAKQKYHNKNQKQNKKNNDILIYELDSVQKNLFCNNEPVQDFIDDDQYEYYEVTQKKNEHVESIQNIVYMDYKHILKTYYRDDEQDYEKYDFDKNDDTDSYDCHNPDQYDSNHEDNDENDYPDEEDSYQNNQSYDSIEDFNDQFMNKLKLNKKNQYNQRNRNYDEEFDSFD